MLEKIYEVLGTINGETCHAGENEDLLEAGLIDSFDIVTLVAELEAAFHIEIDGEEITEENFSTVSRIVELVKRKAL